MPKHHAIATGSSWPHGLTGRGWRRTGARGAAHGWACGLSVSILLALLPAPARAWPPMHFWRLSAPAEAAGPSTIFPHIRLDVARRVVEFDGEVPINAHATDGSVVFLEAVVCRPDTKEHESLVVTAALASHIHAALLLLDLEPGHPGGWRWESQNLVAVAPEGPGLEITISWTDLDGVERSHPATDLIVRRADGVPLTDAPHTSPAASDVFVFAGSRFVEYGGQEVYDADGAGLIVGLHTFGSETIALTRVLSPEATVEEPEWVARRDRLPPRGTPVTVRLQAPPGAPETSPRTPPARGERSPNPPDRSPPRP